MAPVRSPWSSGKLDATTFPAFRRSIITMLLEIEKGAQANERSRSSGNGGSCH
jgi:hypothetical protein